MFCFQINKNLIKNKINYSNLDSEINKISSDVNNNNYQNNNTFKIVSSENSNDKFADKKLEFSEKNIANLTTSASIIFKKEIQENLDNKNSDIKKLTEMETNEQAITITSKINKLLFLL